MSNDEKRWIEDAIDICARAKERGVTLMLVRYRDAEDEQNVSITNAADAGIAKALSNAVYEPGKL